MSAAEGQWIGHPGGGHHIEILSLTLTGSEAKSYAVYYSIYVSEQGWLETATDGALTGGRGHRTQGFRATIVPR